MQGLVDFASQIGEVFAVLLPTFCLSRGAGVLPVRSLGFWMQTPATQSVPRPSMDTVRVAGAGGRVRELRQGADHGARLGRIESFGLDQRLCRAIRRRACLTTSSLMGSTPSATLVNVVTLFQAFFQSFGAMCAFFALLSWRRVINGHANRSQMGCVVQFVFGIMLINILAITNALIAMFVA